MIEISLGGAVRGRERLAIMFSLLAENVPIALPRWTLGGSRGVE